MHSVIGLTYYNIGHDPLAHIMLLEIFLISLVFGMTYAWLVINLVDGHDSDFIIFESDKELQEVCWSGLRHGEK